MFVRVNKTPNSPRKSIQVVESKREKDKVKTKILRHVGIAMDDDEVEKLRQLGHDIIAKLTQEREESSGQLRLFDEGQAPLQPKRGRKPLKKLEDIVPVEQLTLDQIQEEKRIIEGIGEVGGHLFETFGFDQLLKSKKDTQLLKDLTLSRLVFPSSKHKLHQLLADKFHKNYPLEQIYRLMDKLHPLIGMLKAKVFNRSQQLFPKDGVDLMFFDVTTLYFESQEKDALRDFGYSKDFRFNTTQVVLALATNADGLPVGYELFPGKTAEVTTLIAAIENWNTLFEIKNVCFVGDRAMFCEKNLALLAAKKYTYIVAAKLRSLNKNTQEALFNLENYRLQAFGDELGWVGEFPHQGRRLIVSYKRKRALRDQRKRQEILEKIEKGIAKSKGVKAGITNAGLKKYTTCTGQATLALDMEKIAQDEQWDGMHGVITNVDDLGAVEILQRYKRLWVIEDAFRINKHDLKIRPIYHFKPERIETHVAMCYMSFALMKHLHYTVALTQKLSVGKLIEELLDVQASIYVHKTTRDRYRVPGRMSDNARKIYKAFNLQRSQHADIYLN